MKEGKYSAYSNSIIASFSFTLRIIIRGIINAEHGCSPESACMLFWGFLIQDIDVL